MREQRIALEHHANASISRCELCHVTSSDRNRAFTDRIKAGNQAQRCAFSASARPDKGQAFIVADLKGKMSDNPLIGDASSNVLEDKRHPLTAPLVKPETMGF